VITSPEKLVLGLAFLGTVYGVMLALRN